VLLKKVAEKELRGEARASYPRVKKAARQKWPMKRAGTPPPEQPSSRCPGGGRFRAAALLDQGEREH